MLKVVPPTADFLHSKAALSYFFRFFLLCKQLVVMLMYFVHHMQLITNGFNILDAEMNSIATAIFLGVSVTDHSCKPNAVATFEGTTLHIQAIEDIECLDWSKVY